MPQFTNLSQTWSYEDEGIYPMKKWGVSDSSIRKFYGTSISALVEALNRNGSASVDAASILEEVYVRSGSFVPSGEVLFQAIQVEISHFYYLLQYKPSLPLFHARTNNIIRAYCNEAKVTPRDLTDTNVDCILVEVIKS